jgi:hypothetical protein
VSQNLGFLLFISVFAPGLVTGAGHLERHVFILRHQSASQQHCQHRDGRAFHRRQICRSQIADNAAAQRTSFNRNRTIQFHHRHRRGEAESIPNDAEAEGSEQTGLPAHQERELADYRHGDSGRGLAGEPLCQCLFALNNRALAQRESIYVQQPDGTTAKPLNLMCPPRSQRHQEHRRALDAAHL